MGKSCSLVFVLLWLFVILVVSHLVSRRNASILPFSQPGSLIDIITIKIVPHAINSHVLTNLNPCINKAIYVLLMHECDTLHIRFRGSHKI